MKDSEDLENLERVIQKSEPRARLLRAWDLKGGVSAQVTAIEIERPDGGRSKLIVRRHGAADLGDNPNIAADEFRLLQGLQAAGVAAPRPYRVEPPFLIVEYVEGQTEFAPADLDDFLHQLALHLARVHALDGSRLDLSFLPEHEARLTKNLKRRPVRVDDSLDEGRIRDALEAIWPLPRRNKPVLLHGDYWPGNVIWQAGQLRGIVDWEDARVGDPLADLSCTRLEILWAFGPDAMQRFTHHYRTMTALDFTDLPYWDLCAALRPAFKLGEWAADAEAEAAMRARHRWFVDRAFEAISAPA